MKSIEGSWAAGWFTLQEDTASKGTKCSNFLPSAGPWHCWMGMRWGLCWQMAGNHMCRQGRAGEAWVYIGLGAVGWPRLLGPYLAGRTWGASWGSEYVPSEGILHHVWHSRRLVHGMGLVPFRQAVLHPSPSRLSLDVSKAALALHWQLSPDVLTRGIVFAGCLGGAGGDPSPVEGCHSFASVGCSLFPTLQHSLLLPSLLSPSPTAAPAAARIPGRVLLREASCVNAVLPAREGVFTSTVPSCPFSSRDTDCITWLSCLLLTNRRVTLEEHLVLLSWAASAG